MICPYCKSELPDGSQFCSKCGQTIAHQDNQNSVSSTYWSAVEKEVARDDKIRIDAENKIIAKQKKKNRTVIVNYGTKYELGNARMFVIEGMDKVREVIEKNRKRKLAKHKKLSNNRIIEIDNCSPLEIRKLQNNLTMIADNEGLEFVYGKGKRKLALQQLHEELEQCGK